MYGPTEIVWRGKYSFKEGPKGFQGLGISWSFFTSALKEQDNIPCREDLKDLGLGILLESTAGIAQDSGEFSGDWQNPWHISRAASMALTLLLNRDPRLEPAVQIYETYLKLQALEDDGRRLLSSDLGDLVEMANWAVEIGIQKIGFVTHG